MENPLPGFPLRGGLGMGNLGEIQTSQERGVTGGGGSFALIPVD